MKGLSIKKMEYIVKIRPIMGLKLIRLVVIIVSVSRLKSDL